MRILAIAQNTFREAIRDKVLYVLLFFALVVVLGSKALGWISIGQDIKIVKDICLAANSLFGALIAIFVGASLIYKEVDKRTLYTILARPMHRYEFVLGKYLGLMGIIGLTSLIMTVGAGAYIWVLTHTSDWTALQRGAGLDGLFFVASGLIVLKLMIVTAFAVLMSAMSSPILGAIITFCFYIFGHATTVFLDLPPQFDGTVAKELLLWAYYVVPNLSHFDIRSEAANGVPVAPAYLAYVTLYAVLYTAMLLLLAAVSFERKDV